MLVARCMWRIHHHDHACSLGVHARQQCRCLHELWLQSIVACFESATILISTIACYRLHASCMLLRPCPVWPRRDFASRSARILWPSVFLAAIFRTYGRVLPKCRFSRSVLGGLLPYPAPLCTFSVSAMLMCAAFWAVAVRYPVCF